jgi:hypothetical protein
MHLFSFPTDEDEEDHWHFQDGCLLVTRSQIFFKIIRRSFALVSYVAATLTKCVERKT